MSPETPPESFHSHSVSAHISHPVIATYAADAARDVDGVRALVAGSFGSLDRRTDPERAAKAVHVRQAEDGRVSLDVHVAAEHGVSLPDLAERVSEQIGSYLASMVDLDAVDVTVYVDDLAPADASRPD